MDEKRTLKQRAYQGIKDYTVIALYLWLVLGLFVLYNAVLSPDAHHSLVAHGVALLNALALAKVLLLAEELHFAEGLKDHPLIYSTLFKSAAFAMVLVLFKILEEAAIGRYHGKSFRQSILEVGGGTFAGIIVFMAILFVVLIPFFAFSELKRVIGANKLRRLFFDSRIASDDFS